jgi:hypothetical protein
MKNDKQQLKSIDAQDLAGVRGGTFYPLPWVEQQYEPQPEPWKTTIGQVGVVQVGVVAAH